MDWIVQRDLEALVFVTADGCGPVVWLIQLYSADKSPYLVVTARDRTLTWFAARSRRCSFGPAPLGSPDIPGFFSH